VRDRRAGPPAVRLRDGRKRDRRVDPRRERQNPRQSAAGRVSDVSAPIRERRAEHLDAASAACRRSGRSPRLSRRSVPIPDGDGHAFAASGSAPARLRIVNAPGQMHAGFLEELGTPVEDHRTQPAAPTILPMSRSSCRWRPNGA
jgi:hypothetical protein